ncbi:MAG: hypothetical protein AAF602_14640 [Myxococcota bacterium]
MEPAPIVIPAVPSDEGSRVADVVAVSMGGILLSAFERAPLRLVRPSSASVHRYVRDWFMSGLYQRHRGGFRFGFPHRSGRRAIAASVASHWLIAALWATWEELDEQMRSMGWRLVGQRPSRPQPAVAVVRALEAGGPGCGCEVCQRLAGLSR